MEISLDKEHSHLAQVRVSLSFVLGQQTIRVGEVLNLGPGAPLRLNRPAGSEVDLVANGVALGRGRIMVIGGRTYAQVTEIFRDE